MSINALLCKQLGKCALKLKVQSISFLIHDKTDQLSLVTGKGLRKKSPVEACEATGNFS